MGIKKNSVISSKDSFEKLKRDVKEAKGLNSETEGNSPAEILMKQGQHKHMESNKTVFEDMKKELVQKLFNPKSMKQNEFTAVKFAKITGLSESQGYYYLNKLGFQLKNGFRNTNSSKEVADLLWETLTGSQIEKLYNWIDERTLPAVHSFGVGDRTIIIDNSVDDSDGEIKVNIDDLVIALAGEHIHLEKTGDKIVIRSSKTQVSY